MPKQIFQMMIQTQFNGSCWYLNCCLLNGVYVFSSHLLI